jgi:hypothetical protein
VVAPTQMKNLQVLTKKFNLLGQGRQVATPIQTKFSKFDQIANLLGQTLEFKTGYQLELDDSAMGIHLGNGFRLILW